uniref:Uncharacterized protein n=2 Tax=Bos TaxID=9903 RepID=A0A4W2CWT1_BOBOX
RLLWDDGRAFGTKWSTVAAMRRLAMGPRADVGHKGETGGGFEKSGRTRCGQSESQHRR